MPTLNVTTNATVDRVAASDFVRAASSLVAKAVGKPEAKTTLGACFARQVALATATAALHAAVFAPFKAAAIFVVIVEFRPDKMPARCGG